MVALEPQSPSIYPISLALASCVGCCSHRPSSTAMLRSQNDHTSLCQAVRQCRFPRVICKSMRGTPADSIELCMVSTVLSLPAGLESPEHVQPHFRNISAVHLDRLQFGFLYLYSHRQSVVFEASSECVRAYE